MSSLLKTYGTRACLVCQNEFEARSPRQKTCSMKCQRIRRDELLREFRKRRKLMTPNKHRACIVCGSIFMPSRSNEIACSLSCKKERIKQQTRESWDKCKEKLLTKLMEERLI